MQKSMLTLQDVFLAGKNVYRYLKPTPLYHYQGLSDLLDAEVWVKHENHQPVGAFKVRGGLNLAAGLSQSERQAGLFTASTGNHGQSIAFAGRAYGIKVTIAVPEGANPAKVAAMRGLGGEVIFHGPDFDTAREWIMAEAEKCGGFFVGPTDEQLICGVGTYALEIMEELPDVDSIIVPVGAGSGVCGTAIVAKTINPQVEVIGAQSAQAPAMQKSWQFGQLVTAEMKTFAEGVATRVPFKNTQEIMRKYLNDFILVEDSAIKAAILSMLEHTRNIVEAAGAIPLAAALQKKKELSGKKVVLVASGGNITLEQVREILIPA